MKSDRPLTHDERKASEAAFRGLPFDPSWSQSARAVYDGIVKAMAKKGNSPVVPTDIELQSEPAEAGRNGPAVRMAGLERIEGNEGEGRSSQQMTTETAASHDHPSRMQLRSRREAIEAGVLLDVTPMAQRLGLNFAVGMTRPLWDFGIEPDPELSDEECEARIRDVLMAVRLRLACLKDPTPLVEVPVLLTFPPEPIPQVFPIYALFHTDPVDAESLLLMHPGEVMFAKFSPSHN
ncbi:MAG: hypothetical protein D6690_08635 [Nitrospirae bacterium]|nr:MAG: hypothetical protein D6690_08635 [Nitrospirota bacterium]